MQLLLNIKDSSKATLLMEFRKSLNYISSVREIETTDIPEAHKTIVRQRIKESKEDALLDWDKIKSDFNGI